MAHSRGDQVDTNFTRGAPTKFGRVKNEKTSKIQHDFWQLSSLIANMSGMDRHIENPKSTWSTTFHPLLGEKKLWWTLVNKPKSYRRACWPTQVDFFRDTKFRPLGGWHLKFLHALDTGHGLLAHTTNWVGGPSPKKILRANIYPERDKISKIKDMWSQANPPAFSQTSRWILVHYP